MDREALRSKLVSSIAKHCSQIAKEAVELERHATRILVFRDNHERIMRRFTAQEPLLELERHLRLAEFQIEKLQNEHAQALNSIVYAMPALTIEERHFLDNGMVPTKEIYKKYTTIEKIHRGAVIGTQKGEELVEAETMPQHPDKLNNRLEAISSFRSGLAAFRKSYVAKSPSLTTSENPEAAAIASACRQTWREVYGDKKVPKKPSANPLGPMARFIDEILGILETPGRTDPKNPKETIPPNPVSALNFVDRLGGDDALELSLTWD